MRLWLPVTALALSLACGRPPAPDAPRTEEVAKAEPTPPTPSEQAPTTPIADQYRDAAQKIIAAALASERSWQRLAHLSDNIGNRLSGSANLDSAIRWAADEMRAGGLDVRLQEVMVPHWVRGEETAAIVEPVERRMRILGLGGSVGTRGAGVRGEVVTAASFEELEALGPAVKGKIVLFTHAMPSYTEEHGSGYGTAYVFRSRGPSQAAKLGAKAVLVRSLTAHSLRSPHTGGMRYEEGVAKIPAAAVTIEDAERIQRYVAAGEKVTVSLKMGAQTFPDKKSANVIGELVGSERPDEIVVIGCHIDTWDVGDGAHDDGGGCVVMMEAAQLLHELGLKPRRTIRVVLFTNEENGLRGAYKYAEANSEAIDKHVMAFESDSGIFDPRGVSVQVDEAVPILKDIVTLLSRFEGVEASPGYGGADIGPLGERGVPCLGLQVDGSRHFDLHHTEADTLDKVDPEDLRQNVAVAAVIAYVVADMETPLPRAPVKASEDSEH